MTIQRDIRETVANRLTIETLQILKEIAQQRPLANGGSMLEWFQGTINAAIAANQGAREIAAIIVMGAYADELESKSFNIDRLEERVRQGILTTLQ